MEGAAGRHGESNRSPARRAFSYHVRNMDDTTKARRMSKPSRFPAVAGALAGLLAATLGAWYLYPQHVGPGGASTRPAAASASPSAAPAAAASATASPATSSSPSPALQPQQPAPGQALSREQAVARLMALPELQAWARHIESASGGAVRGAVMPFDPALRTVNGRQYYQLGFVENRPDAAVTWQGFLVGAADGAILVDDEAAPLPLERWRLEKRPLERTAR